ncbi:MAG: HDOD domain-containing protein [Syntrophales bacterium]
MNINQEKIIDEKSVLRTIDKVAALPTVPHVLLHVNKMLQDEDASVKEMANIIESDQVITSRILKLVNSAFYGFRSGIVEIPQAVMILGFNTVRNAVAAVSLIDLFHMKEKYDGFDIQDLWKHSISVAVTSKCLAQSARLTIPGDCFVAGLLHDIGKLVMAECLEDIFGRVLKLTHEEDISFFEAERRISSVDHAMIGGYLTQKWQFPQSLVDTIMYHHMVNRNAADFWLHASVYAANIIVNNSSNMNIVADNLVGSCHELSEVVNRLGALSEWYDAVDSEIAQVSKFFLEDDNP